MRHDFAKPLPFLRPPKPRWPMEVLRAVLVALLVCLLLAWKHGGAR